MVETAQAQSTGGRREVPADNQEIWLEAVEILKAYREEALNDRARKDRLELTALNYKEYRGDKDWAHKTEGQSTEHLPRLSSGVDQVTMFVKRGLVDVGKWYDIEIQGDALPYIEPEDLRKLMDISLASNDLNLATKMSDAARQGILEGLITTKVRGEFKDKTKFRAERVGVDPVADPATGQIVALAPRMALRKKRASFRRTTVDLLPLSDYIPDPRGRDMFCFHEFTRDFWEVKADAKRGKYDMAVVESIEAQEFHRDDEDKLKRARGQYRNLGSKFRREITLSEFWGTLVGEDGEVLMIPGEDGQMIPAVNVLATLANGKYLIRPPRPNPRWDDARPIVSAPLMRLGHTVYHRALADDARSINNALDELLNLMLDAAMMGAYGIRQLRLDMLDDVDEASNGIPPGTTLIIRDGAPADAKVLERVDTGSLAPESIAIFNLLMREQEGALRTNSLSLGQLPARQVKATEVVQATSATTSLFDGVIRDVEDSVIEPMLELAFHDTMQYLDQMDPEDVVAAVGAPKGAVLLNLTPEERFALFANRVKFRVNGLSGLIKRAQEFQKLMAMVQMMMVNPTLMMLYAQKYSFEKLLDRLLRTMDIDQASLAVDKSEVQSQLLLMKLYMMNQKQAAEGGQPGPSFDALPSAQADSPVQTPPGIEGGGGENTFSGGSMSQRSM